MIPQYYIRAKIKENDTRNNFFFHLTLMQYRYQYYIEVTKSETLHVLNESNNRAARATILQHCNTRQHYNATM